MDFNQLRSLPVLDAHIHLPFPALVTDLEELIGEMNLERINLVSTPDVAEINHNPAVIAYKAKHPTTTFICGGLDHFSVQLDPAHMPEAFAAQVRSLHEAGFDGLKLLESKPIARKMINIPMDGPVYAPMWAELEALSMPVVWHVADPEEFWDEEKCPAWVKQSGWFYGDGTYPLKEALYSEVETVVSRHPNLKVILAHFFFLSADLPRAARFLDAHSNVCFDLTPGSEMFFNFMRDSNASREFFLKYQQRLIFGTDSGASAVGKTGQPLNRAETLGRTYFVRDFLENAGPLEIPDGVAHWRRAGQELQGLSLPEEALRNIYAHNFERLFEKTPRALQLPKCIEMLENQANFLDQSARTTVNSSARQVAVQLSQI